MERRVLPEYSLSEISSTCSVSLPLSGVVLLTVRSLDRLLVPFLDSLNFCHCAPAGLGCVLPTFNSVCNRELPGESSTHRMLVLLIVLKISEGVRRAEARLSCWEMRTWRRRSISRYRLATEPTRILLTITGTSS